MSTEEVLVFSVRGRWLEVLTKDNANEASSRLHGTMRWQYATALSDDNGQVVMQTPLQVLVTIRSTQEQHI
jgi:hypothetical protein